MTGAERTTLDMLLGAFVGHLRGFVVMTEEQADACALWGGHTHVYEAFRFTPYLNPQSATKQSGKTRLLEVLRPVCARPIDTDGITPAALIRTVDKERPTLLLDESDATFSGSKELAETLRGVLNSGFRSRGNYVFCVGEGANMTTRSYSTFCPKALAGIGRLPDTIADRSIPIRLSRRAPGESIREFEEEAWEHEGESLARMIVDELAPRFEELAAARPERPDGISDRAKDAWKPLLAVAELAGGEWPERARTAARVLCADRELDEQEIAIRLLGALAAAFEQRDADRLTSAELVEYLHGQKDEPWADWSRGNPITARRVADLLRPFEIRPRVIRTEAGTPRGYERHRCEDAFARYLPRRSGSNRNNRNNGSSKPETAPFQSATEAQMLHFENPEKPHERGNVADVALSEGLAGETAEILDFQHGASPPPSAELEAKAAALGIHLTDDEEEGL